MERSQNTRRRWGLRTIRARIALILAVPTVLLIVIASVGVFGQLRASSDAAATADNVGLVLSAQELVHSLQKERGLSVGLIGGASDYRSLLDQVRKASNDTRTSLDQLLNANPSAASTRVRVAEGKLDTLTATRGTVDAGQATKADVYNFYSNAISALTDAMFAGDVGQEDAELRRGMSALRSLSLGKEQTGRERATLNGVFATGYFSKSEYPLFNQIRAAKLAGFDDFTRLAAQNWADDFAAALRTPQATTMLTLEERALASPGARRLGVTPKVWWNAITAFIDDLHQVQLKVGADIQARAEKIKADARQNLLLYSGGTAALLIAALLFGFMTFRSIVRPLRLLTSEAHDAAEQRLPSAVERIQTAEDPAGVVLESSRSTLARRADEFAEVATALDHLQQTAVRLAVEQAVMRRNTAESLANLGRRNQNLVRRQLGFISALEKEEADPNQLANLFELDHLATRMRRNAESLLVLVGERSPRKWTGSIAVGDILRSAFAEVEDYRRVVLRRVDDVRVQGAAAAEISHLLAELVENALSFSPPDQEVEVQARATSAEYHIAIVDQGIGMNEGAIATANLRLRGAQSFLVQPTRDLGHYVVGQLARRLGIRVWLHDSPLNGVTARVVIPAALLAVPEEAPAAPPQYAPPPPAVTSTGTFAAAGVALDVRPAPPRQQIAPPPARTANGLAKRPPRGTDSTRLRRPERPAPAEPVPPHRTPGEVQSMLTNFRAGYQRAEQARHNQPGTES